MLNEKQQDQVFKALANQTRRKILDLLKARERTTGELCNALKRMDRCTVMQHLDVLESADLIIVKRKGRQRWNHLNVDPILGIYDRWISRYASAAVRLLSRLKHDLEK